jgi:hypothetical protein
MEILILVGFILIAMFLTGLIGLITSKENKNGFLILMLVPIILLVIGFGTCVAMLS